MVFIGIEFVTPFGKPESKFHVPTQQFLTLGGLDLDWDMEFGLSLPKEVKTILTKLNTVKDQKVTITTHY